MPGLRMRGMPIAAPRAPRRSSAVQTSRRRAGSPNAGSEPLGQPGQRKIAAPRADQRFELELDTVIAGPLVLEPFAPVVETAHMDAPQQVQGFAEGFHGVFTPMRAPSGRCRACVVPSTS